jgi:hypothetical protein
VETLMPALFENETLGSSVGVSRSLFQKANVIFCHRFY